ncbi:MAG: flagellar export chaperone FliS [Phycisphaeraceae bacterium]
MTPQGPNPYLRTKILTASPEELRLMLYEGAIRFCRQALPALQSKNFEASYNALMRAQKIVLELSTSLNPDVAPDLCERLGALYTYIYRKLVDANLERKPELVSEALRLLEYEKETWQMLMKKLVQGDTNLSGAQQTAMSSLSTRG